MTFHAAGRIGPEGLLIRRADLSCAADARAVGLLVEAYRLESQPGLVQRSDEALGAMVGRLAGMGSALVFLAWLEGEAVGVAVCFAGLSTWTGLPLINIHDLAVAASQRGRGIGRALLRAVAEYGRASGCCRLTLEVLASNTGAMALYRSEGYGRGGAETYFLSLELAGG